MPRVKLTEYRSKKLIVGDSYPGFSIVSGVKTMFSKDGQFVVKVDQGVKRRMKQGLVALDQTEEETQVHIKEWEKKGFTRFLVEPMIPHAPEDERYLSLERVREGLRLLYARTGGIEIESNPEKVETYVLKSSSDIERTAQKTGLPKIFLSNLVEVFEKNFFAFLEINPLVIKEGEVVPLDAAVLVDSVGTYFVRGSWGEEDVVASGTKNKTEERVAILAKTTPASLKLSVLNENGSLFLLLSGGGGSIVIADEAALLGFGKEIGNYGEYSGGPTREETYLYAKEVIELMLASKAQKKALVIAGGVANFTDIKETFSGVIDALSLAASRLRKANIKIFVRRGGPNEKAGLELMEAFLKHENLLGSVHGSGDIITSAVDDAISYLKS